MSKQIKYTCDNGECSRFTNNIERDNWIEIGSENDTLKINNHLKDRRLISVKNYYDMHFCSSKCLIENFIHKDCQAVP